MSLSLPSGVAAAPDRGRIPSVATLALLAVLAWAAVILWARSSGMMDAMQATLSGAVLFAGMWLVMMAAMMLPAVTPVVVLFRTLQRGRGAQGARVVPTAAFVGGYLVVWTLAGIAADLIYLAAQGLGTRLQVDAGAVPIIGGAIIALAGIYQFSPLKYVCLSHCRSPFHFILHGWHEGRLGALRMGASHGAYCLGCCWGIMAVLFVVGLMNLAWMAALSVLIVVEKLAPRGVGIGRLVGVLFIALGLLMAVRPQLFPAAGLQPAGAMAGMAPATPATGVSRYGAVAGPYALTLTVQPQQGSLTVSVTDRSMGMAVAGARVSLRLEGMGAPAGPVALHPLMGSMDEGRYGATVQLMSGDYTAGIEVNGHQARVHIRVP